MLCCWPEFAGWLLAIVCAFIGFLLWFLLPSAVLQRDVMVRNA